MKSILEAKIAWVLCNLLQEVTEQLWNRYDREFIRLATEEEKEDVRIGEMVSQMDPDSSSKPEF